MIKIEIFYDKDTNIPNKYDKYIISINGYYKAIV